MNILNSDKLYANVIQLIQNNTLFNFDTAIDFDNLTKGEIGKLTYQMITKTSSYIDNHLSMENKFMLIYDFDNADEHASQHKDFVSAFNNYKFEYTSYGSSKLLASQLKQLMDRWQKEHIVSADKYLCQFLGKRIWNDSMKTGVKSIDNEHTALFSMLNNLLIQIEFTPDKDEILKSFKFFNAYVDKHFKNEEAIMEKYKYPDISEHKAIHERLKFTVFQLHDVLQEEPLTDSVKKDLKALSSDWLVEHVLQEDMKVTQHINS